MDKRVCLAIQHQLMVMLVFGASADMQWNALSCLMSHLVHGGSCPDTGQ